MNPMSLSFVFFLLAQSADPGDMYHGLRNDDGRDCCGQNDCRVYGESEIRFNPDMQILYNGEWIDVPESAILRQGSWDGMFRACVVEGFGARGNVIVKQYHVLCVLLPGVV